MKHQLEYEKDFDEAWDELKKAVKQQINDSDCIAEDNKMKWPCWVCVYKRKKEYYHKH